MKKDISIVIPVYKKTDMFIENLKKNAKFFLEVQEVIVVDDASKENLREKIEEAVHIPQLKVLENRKNLGFSGAINKGIFASTAKYVLLLNSDIQLLKPIPDTIFAFFDDPLAAAVSFAEKEGEKILGKSIIQFKRGLVVHNRASNAQTGLTAWANGGSAMFRADYLKTLKGFDEIYNPFYWEDIDLSYRAYSRGYKILFDSEYIVQHARESTISSFYKPTRIKYIAFRNQFYFTWSNIVDPGLLLLHILWLPVNLCLMLIKGEFGFVRGFFTALLSLPRIIKRRFIKVKHQKVSDKKIFSLFS